MSRYFSKKYLYIYFADAKHQETGYVEKYGKSKSSVIVHHIDPRYNNVTTKFHEGQHGGRGMIPIHIDGTFARGGRGRGGGGGSNSVRNCHQNYLGLIVGVFISIAYLCKVIWYEDNPKYQWKSEGVE